MSKLNDYIISVRVKARSKKAALMRVFPPTAFPSDKDRDGSYVVHYTCRKEEPAPVEMRVEREPCRCGQTACPLCVGSVPEGVTIVSMSDTASVHAAIAEAVGE